MPHIERPRRVAEAITRFLHTDGTQDALHDVSSLT